LHIAFKVFRIQLFMVNTQIDQRTSHKVRETRSLENLTLLTICLLTASIVVCYQDVYTATFRSHRFRSLVRTQRLKCETGSQLLGPFRTAVSHFRRFVFRVSLSQFRDAPKSKRHLADGRTIRRYGDRRTPPTIEPQYFK
jgi:hypothetical protein